MWKKTVHHRHIHTRHDSNNAMESFNTIRFMFAPRRGFNDPNSLIKALRIHYNHVRPTRA